MTNNRKKILCATLASALVLGVGISSALVPISAGASSYASGAFGRSPLSKMQYEFRTTATTIPNAVKPSVILTGNLGWFYTPIADRYPVDFDDYATDSRPDDVNGYPSLPLYGLVAGDNYIPSEDIARKLLSVYQSASNQSEIWLNNCTLTLPGLNAIPPNQFQDFTFTTYDAGHYVNMSCSVFDYNSRVWRDIRAEYFPTSTDQTSTIFLSDFGGDLAPYAYTERQTSVYMVRDLTISIDFNPTTQAELVFEYTPGDFDTPLGYTDTADSAFSKLTDRIEDVQYIELSPIETIISSVTAFFATEFVPGFAVGDLLLIALGTMIFGAFLKIFLGG